MSLAETVREAARRFGDRAVLLGGDFSLTYADLDRRSDRVAGGLAAAGVGEGDVVAITRRSDDGYLVALAAASKVGAVAAGINPSLAEAERNQLVEFLAPAAVVTDGDLPEGDAPPPLPPDPDRPAVIVFTSGTTGTPKAAWFRNRELDAVRRIDLGPLAEEWGGGGPMLASTQFAHIGITTKLSWYLRRGTTLVRVDPWRADAVLEAVARHRIDSIGGVAPQIALLLRSPLMHTLDLSCVRLLIVGGAASSPALVAEATERFGAGYSIRYSSTESGGVGLGTDPAGDTDEVLHTVGRPRPGVEARIVDPADGGELPDGEVGELCIRSGAQFVGYWGHPEATAQVLRDGWVHTGDLAVRDERGLYRLRGRIKEQYVRGGYNVAPAEVEAVLGLHPDVDQVAVVPRPDPVMGEIGVAVVVPVEGRPGPTLDALRSHAGEHLARWKLPEHLVLVEELPLTPMQKIDRAALSDLVGG